MQYVPTVETTVALITLETSFFSPFSLVDEGMPCHIILKTRAKRSQFQKHCFVIRKKCYWSPKQYFSCARCSMYKSIICPYQENNTYFPKISICFLGLQIFKRELEIHASAALLAIKPKKLKKLHHIAGEKTAPGCC